MATAPAPAPNRTARVLAILSGKGGVGKTTLAVNLAIALASRGQRVYLWDLDLGLANIDVLLNLNARADLRQLLSGAMGVDQIALEGPKGIKVVPGASGDERVANLGERGRRRLVRAMADIAPRTDYILLDLGAGVSGNTLAFARAAAEIVLVTTPEPTALVDAYAAFKILHRQGVDQVYLMINMARTVREAQKTAWRMNYIVEQYLQTRLTADGFILQDAAVGESVRRRLPFVLAYPRSEAAQSVRALAEMIVSASPPRREGRDENFIKRLMGHFAAA